MDTTTNLGTPSQIPPRQVISGFAKGLAGLLASATALLAVTVPSGFSHSQIGGALTSPTAFAIAADGRIFVCEQGGKLRVIKNGTLLTAPFLTVTVDSAGERGLLGVAFDPVFATNRYVYVYYTATSPAKHNRLSRFTANGDVAVAASEVILLELNNLSSATNHNGGALHFGGDGKLYVAVGENATSSNAQTTTNLLGKLLRLNPNGTIPTDNPFYSTASGKNRAIWALGLRNPFTFAVQPGTGRIFINDVGQGSFEEVNEGLKGANYGWPTTEGPTSNPSFESPTYSYPNGAAECAITGGAFYNPSTVQFPSGYVGDYFFADYCANWIKRLDAAGAYTAASGFATGISKPVGVAIAPDGSLYYLARGTGTSTGGVHRIQYTLNTPPAITAQPQDRRVTVGDSVTFSVSASGTPPLSYQWQRDGVAISGATSSSYTIASAQLVDDGIGFRCRVANAYGSVTSNPATLAVTASLAPTAGITSPAAGTNYAGGQTISYSGTGTDPEDGTLPASAFVWEVVFHHNTHTHPFIAPKSGSKSGSFVIPTTGETSDNVWYRIHLTVTDSDGLSHAVYRDVVPRKSTMTFATNPTGLQITLDGQPLTTPATVVGVEGIARTLGVVSPQNKGGVEYGFASWSDGGVTTHDISTPVADTTYTAAFASATATKTRTPTRTPTRTSTPAATRTPTRTPTPIPVSSLPFNGSFEGGSGSPSGWTLGTSATNGNWSWDASTAAAGTRSAKVSVPGTVAMTSPVLRSSSFALAPARSYTFSVWTKSSGVGGSNGILVRLVERDASNVDLVSSGTVVRHLIQGGLGTTAWTQKTITFNTDPRCARAYVDAKISLGYGTAWVDDIVVMPLSPPAGTSLPAPWSDQDIGPVGQAGNAAESGGTYTVVGSGANIAGTSDGFHFVYQPMSGDGEIVARITGVQNTTTNSKGGIMIRESLAANSSNVAMILTGGNRFQFQVRASTGATTSNWSGNQTPPHWVKLVRSGNTFTAYRSSNGVNWTLYAASPVAVPMANDVYVGLVMSSNDNAVLGTATLDNVAKSP